MNIFKVASDIGYGSNTYFIVSGPHAAIVDPSINYNSDIKFLGPGCSVDYVIITHAHFDHILKVEEWRKNTNAKVVIGKLDAPALSNPDVNCYGLFFNSRDGYFGPYETVSDGEEILLGTEKIKILATPGHTVGSITLLCGDGAIVGDVVFAHGAIGRTDLPGGDYSTLMQSIEKIISLSNDSVIYPGHGDVTTVKEIKLWKR